MRVIMVGINSKTITFVVIMNSLGVGDFFFFKYASSGLIYASIFGPPPASNNTHNRVRSSLWWIPSHELQTCLQRTRRGSLAFMA